MIERYKNKKKIEKSKIEIFKEIFGDGSYICWPCPTSAFPDNMDLINHNQTLQSDGSSPIHEESPNNLQKQNSDNSQQENNDLLQKANVNHDDILQENNNSFQETKIEEFNGEQNSTI